MLAGFVEHLFFANFSEGSWYYVRTGGEYFINVVTGGLEKNMMVLGFVGIL